MYFVLFSLALCTMLHYIIECTRICEPQICITKSYSNQDYKIQLYLVFISIHIFVKSSQFVLHIVVVIFIYTGLNLEIIRN